MTVIDATRNLLKFFSENDVFKIKEDLKKVVTITLDETLDLDIVLLALTELAERGIVKPLVLFGQKTFLPYGYVLTKPLVEYSQSLELCFENLSSIAETVNSFCDSLNLEKGRVNPLNVREEDIASLLIIIQTLQNQIQGNE